MSRKLLSTILMAFFFLAQVHPVQAMESVSDSQEVSAITITLSNKDLRVQNAENNILKVYNITGVCVANFRVDSNDKTFVLNQQRGCYIIKIGKMARKVYLR